MDLRENDHSRVKEMSVSSCEVKKSDSQWRRVSHENWLSIVKIIFGVLLTILIHFQTFATRRKV